MKLSSENTSTSIYLEQIQNQIDLAVGYAKIRPHLFKELITADGSNPNSDDRLADAIVTKLTNNLNENLHSSEKIDRTIKIIEDLLTYAQDIMTPAMHNQQFILAMVNVAIPKIITFNSKLDEYSRLRVGGMFLFWFDRYARQQKCDYELFIIAYKNLRDRKMLFPDNPTIKPNDSFKKQLKSQNVNTGDNTTQLVLDDIQQFTKKTQFQMKQNLKSVVNTQYVRLIKYESKILYQFTQKGSTLSEKQKNTVKDLYKRLRNVLKQVQKVNQTKLETKNSIKQQQAYVQQKMTPKKTEKDAPKNEDLTEIPNNEPKVIKSFSKHTSSQSKKLQTNTIDLLNINDETTQHKSKMDTSEKKLTIITPPKISTPNKNIQNETLKPTNIDLLGQNIQKKVPQVVVEDQQFVEGTFVQSQIQKSPQQLKQKQQQKMNKDLFQVFSTPKKSDNANNNQQEQAVLAKNSSKKSNTESVQLQNEQNKKNKYSFIPNDLKLTPTSSNEDAQTPKKEGFGFNLFGLFGAKKQSQKNQGLYDQNKPYDYVPEYLMNKVQSSNQKGQSTITEGNTIKQFESNNFYNLKPVKAVDYSQNILQRSPSQHDEQQHFHPKIDFQNLQQLAIEATQIKDKQGKQLLQSQD